VRNGAALHQIMIIIIVAYKLSLIQRGAHMPPHVCVCACVRVCLHVRAGMMVYRRHRSSITKR
jgi:hypothetical protein